MARLVPRLSRDAWVVLAGDALSAIGSGMTLPFFVVYLNTIRGIGLALAALAVSTLALAGLVGNPLGGWLSDRIGARYAVVIGLLVSSVGTGSLVFVRSTWQAFVSAAVVGLGAAITWPALDTLLATVVPPGQRSTVFSVRHATMNAGLGLGAVMAALIVHDGSSTTFVALYVVDAVSFLLFVPIALSVHPRTDDAGAVETSADIGDQPARAGFARVLHDTVFVRLWLLTAALVAVGYAQLNGIFPAFVARPEGVSTSVVGLIFAVNTIGVVTIQLLVLRFMAGRRRCAGLQLAALFWAATWALTYGAGTLGGGAGAVAGFILAGAVFAIGETFLAPSLAPMVNDLAPDDLRGRYNGLYTLAWTSGFAVGPAVAGLALEKKGSEVFIGLVLVCGVIVWGAGRLDRHVLPAARLVTVDAA